MTSSSQRGAAIEQAACRYLQTQGLEHLCSNYRARTGELDLIMLDAGTLVFIEVRYRRTLRFGSPAMSVNIRKQRRLRRTAEVFLLHHSRFRKHACRFDVISVSGPVQQPEMQWLQRAF